MLVTGAAGFIGSHVADELVASGFRVVGLDDLSGGFPENVPHGVEFVKGSICDIELVKGLFRRNRFSYVFHFAAYAAENLSHLVRGFIYQNNLQGSVNLINASVNSGEVKGFVFASSAAVYGETRTAAVETRAPRPQDPYAISKFAIELDLQAAAKSFNLPFVIFRLHNVYGEKQNIVDPCRNVIGIFMRQILEGAPLTIFGDGSQKRSFTHVSEIAPVIAGAINNSRAQNQIFNLGTDRQTSVLQIAEMVSHAMGVKTKIKFLPERNECHTIRCSHGKVRKVFRKKMNAVTLELGLRRVAAWVRERGIPESKPLPFSAVEIPSALPDYWRAALEQPERSRKVHL